MSVLTRIDPKSLAARMNAGEVTLVDIREPDEHAKEHIPGAILVPLSRLAQGGLTLETRGDVVFHCRSGGRTTQHCARLAAHVDGPAYELEGGIEAWKKAGLAVASGTPPAMSAAPASAQAGASAIERQVRLIAGGLVLLGAALAAWVHPGFILLSGFVGAALLFAGATGFCLMEKLLARAPWNRPGSRRAAA